MSGRSQEKLIREIITTVTDPHERVESLAKMLKDAHPGHVDVKLMLIGITTALAEIDATKATPKKVAK